jgi:hypothetical protein
MRIKIIRSFLHVVLAFTAQTMLRAKGRANLARSSARQQRIHAVDPLRGPSAHLTSSNAGRVSQQSQTSIAELFRQRATRLEILTQDFYS